MSRRILLAAVLCLAAYGARADEHEHLPRRDSPDGQGAVGLVHYGHDRNSRARGSILQWRDPHTLRCG